MKNFLSQLALGLEPYIPGEQPKDKKYVKLNTNENPYPPSEKVEAAIHSVPMDQLRLYPDPESTDLRVTIADYLNGLMDCESAILTATNVFMGNGSDEVLAFVFPAFFTGRYIVFPNITYSFYPVYANLFQTEYREIPLLEDFSVRVEDYLELASKGDLGADGILIPNPNAPTGRALTKAEIEQIVASNPDIVVVVDEAYIDFGGESAVDLVPKYDNLLVVHTLSKSRSLAGLRVGFAIGSDQLIDGLNRVKNSFNSYTMDRIAMAGAKAAILDHDYFNENRNRIISTRERVVARLETMGFEVVPSKANFIFISHETKAAAELFSRLREMGILVRYFKKPLIDDHLRVSIGTDEEMDQFLKALESLI
ncbi:histidinol-phosphate transaminase [Acidaminobacter sp.]|uniref:histidinol-phosphate transaminase n=1 Tax=Acidaminobacter sp. TaxID=1872102 RepID=UPI00256C0E11|nr:histidinol-phosphate transaminase [Acidaminobacter sp.]MDK9710653.1 histidinol-phosphate transaminase [Acidaminobacter sp.]